MVHSTQDDDSDPNRLLHSIGLSTLAAPINNAGLSSKNASFASPRNSASSRLEMSIDDAVHLVFESGDDDSGSSGDSAPPPVASFGSADILRSIDLAVSQQKNERSARAASSNRAVVVDPLTTTVSPHRELTEEEHEDMTRQAALRSLIASLRPSAAQTSQEAAAATRRGKRQHGTRILRSMSLAAPPTDVLRRLSCPPGEFEENEYLDMYADAQLGDPLGLFHVPGDESAVVNSFETPPPPPPREASMSSDELRELVLGL
jgi:hypothetical protein